MTPGQRIASLIDKGAFLRAAEVAHLCAGGETPILRSHTTAVEQFFALKSGGFDGRETGLMSLLARVRGRAGNLLGVATDDIAFLNSSSEGLAQLAAELDWRAGDNVVVEDIEFPSGLYPWTTLAARGVEVRVVRQSDGAGSLDRLAAALDARTRVLATSQVSYLTGRRYDLAALRALADRHGALLSIDATHAAGVVPVEARHADILVSSCYKFLLGVHGAAIFYRNPARLGDLAPRGPGWHSVASAHTVAAPTTFTLRPTADRFEAGNPPFMALAVLDNALATLERIGIARIERHVLALGSRLWPALRERGLTLLTPEDPARRGPNICFAWPDAVGLAEVLADRGVLVWGGDGRVRVSFHAYNDDADLDRLLVALDAHLAAQAA